MSSEENAATARRWFTQGWSGDVAMADDIFASEFATNGLIVGLAGPKRNVANRLAGFPDISITIEEQIAAGDTVVTRLLWRGTHTGPYSGVPPTGKPVEARSIAIWHFASGKAVEAWNVLDQFGLLPQIGAIPPQITGAQVPAPSDEGAGALRESRANGSCD